MIEKYGIQEIYNKYSQFVDVAKNKVFFGVPNDYEGPDNNFEISEIISDSVVLVSHDVENVASVNNFIGSIHLFLELGVASGFMFRGCVSQGNIIFDRQRSIFISKEFNDLAKFEPKINAPVCVIFDEAKPTVLSSIFGREAGSGGVTPLRSLPLIKWSVPLKGEIIIDFWCVNYTFFCNNKQIRAAIEYLAGDVAKQNNFIKYLEYLELFSEETLDGDNSNYLKFMRSRSGMRVAFVDANGDVVQPPVEWGFPSVFIEPPQQIAVHVDGSGQVKFTAQGRWG